MEWEEQLVSMAGADDIGIQRHDCVHWKILKCGTSYSNRETFTTDGIKFDVTRGGCKSM